MIKSEIAIIGAGIGGLTLAYALEKQGIPFQIYERADSFEALGYGIQLSPNVVRVLEALGLESSLKKISHQCLGFELRSFYSDEILATWKLNQKTPYYQCRRSDLHQSLFNHISDKNKIHFSHHLDTYQQQNNHLILNFNQQNALTTNALIAADGVRSQIRTSLFPHLQPEYTGYTAYRAILPFKDNYNYLLGKAIVWLGENHHVVAYPNGSQKDWVNLVLVVKDKNWTEENWSILANKEDIIREFKNQSSLLNNLLNDLLNTPELCLKWGLFTHQILPYWSQNNITLLGDAAHPMLPFQAQGAAMAIEDAYSLAQFLAQETDIKTAFIKYQNTRLQRTAKVQKVSRNNANVFHASGLKAIVRNNIFRLLSDFYPDFFNQRISWLYDYNIIKAN